jgi:hypothetical protein
MHPRVEFDFSPSLIGLIFFFSDRGLIDLRLGYFIRVGEYG